MSSLEAIRDEFSDGEGEGDGDGEDKGNGGWRSEESSGRGLLNEREGWVGEEWRNWKSDRYKGWGLNVRDRKDLSWFLESMVFIKDEVNFVKFLWNKTELSLPVRDPEKDL